MSDFIRQATGEFGEIRERLVEAFKQQGFGLLTNVNVKAVVKEKLNEEMTPYEILGFCNPPFAYQALVKQPRIGIFMPCNVVVRETAPGQSEIIATDPVNMVDMYPDLQEIAAEICKRIQAALNSLEPAK